MRKNIVSILLLVGLISVSLANLRLVNANGVVPSQNDIVVDGVIGTDWTDGNYTLMIDDTPGELEELYLSVNATGLNVALVATLTVNEMGRHVFFDIDGLTSGLSSLTEASGWNDRPVAFTNGFRPDFFIGAWGNASWDLFSATAWLGPVGKTVGLVPGLVTYEAFIPFTTLYPAGIPVEAKIGIAAIRIGGGGDGTLFDAIPSNKLTSCDNHVVLPIDSNKDQIPDLINPVIGWAGNDADSSAAGVGVVGLPLEVRVAVWSGTNNFPNSTRFPTLNYRIYDNSTLTWGSEVNVKMYHYFGDYDGNNDWHRYSIATGTLDVDDKIQWNATTTYGTTTTHEVIFGPMPPIDIGFVGGIDPSGGFVLPDIDFSIVVQVEQLWEGITRVTGDFNLDVVLNYTIDEGVTWLTKPFAWDAIVGQNAQYRTTFIGGFPENTNMTFTINVTSNNDTELTAPISFRILVPPPEVEIFYMTDPTGDEYGVYPTKPGEFPADVRGLFDLMEFNVTANEYVTTFHFRLNNTFDPGWGKGLWSHPIFGIMIDAIPGGATTALSDIFANTEAAYPWDYGFQIEGWMQKYYTPATLDDPQSASTGITLGYEKVDEEFWYSFTVPKTLIGAVAVPSWKYFVVVGSGDTNHFRAHNAVEEDYRFGGGKDGNIDPNYVDILVPAGGDSKAVQEYINSHYSTVTSTMTTLLAVGEGLVFVPDTTDPLVEITAPIAGATFDIASGATTAEVVITWTASDSAVGTFAGIDIIEVFAGSVLQSPIGDGTATLHLAAGTYTLRVNVYDNTGNYATDTVTITVNPAPEEKPVIPGYPIGFILLASFAVIVYLLKKRV